MVLEAYRNWNLKVNMTEYAARTEFNFAGELKDSLKTAQLKGTLFSLCESQEKTVHSQTAVLQNGAAKTSLSLR